jgi:hypothetical protein
MQPVGGCVQTENEISVCSMGPKGAPKAPLVVSKARKHGAVQGGGRLGAVERHTLVWVGIGRGRNARSDRDETADVSMA